jgi:hypothetical protein
MRIPAGRPKPQTVDIMKPLLTYITVPPHHRQFLMIGRQWDLTEKLPFVAPTAFVPTQRSVHQPWRLTRTSDQVGCGAISKGF